MRVKNVIFTTLILLSASFLFSSCAGPAHRADGRQDHRDDRQDGRQDHRDDRQDGRW